MESKDKFPVANLGEDVLLSCELTVAPTSTTTTTTTTTTGGVELLWTKANTSGVVYEYQNGAPELKDQNPQFDGRVHVVKTEVEKGNGSLLITAVRNTDAGVYTCTLSASTGSGSLDITLRTAGQYGVDADDAVYLYCYMIIIFTCTFFFGVKIVNLSFILLLLPHVT